MVWAASCGIRSEAADKSVETVNLLPRTLCLNKSFIAYLLSPNNTDRASGIFLLMTSNTGCLYVYSSDTREAGDFVTTRNLPPRSGREITT